MTFRKFAKKFQQKANEWEMVKETGNLPDTFDTDNFDLPPIKRRKARLKVIYKFLKTSEVNDLDLVSLGQ